MPEPSSRSVPTRTPVRVEDIPPAVRKSLPDGGEDRDTWRKTIIDPDDSQAVFYVRFAPHQVGSRHRHTSDTLYLFVRGRLEIPGEGTFHAGELRWVRGGVGYGPERAGPEGCEFYFVSLGPFGTEPLADEEERSPGGA